MEGGRIGYRPLLSPSPLTDRGLKPKLASGGITVLSALTSGLSTRLTPRKRWGYRCVVRRAPLRQQAELEFRILAGRIDAVAAEREWESTRRRLIVHKEALRAVLETARALQRTPDAVSVQDVTACGGSH